MEIVHSETGLFPMLQVDTTPRATITGGSAHRCELNCKQRRDVAGKNSSQNLVQTVSYSLHRCNVGWREMEDR